MVSNSVAKDVTHREPNHPVNLTLGNISVLYESQHITSSYFSALFLKELGVNLLADDLGADVIFYSDAKPHLFKYKLHFLLFFHGAICLNLSMREGIKVENSMSNRTNLAHIKLQAIVHA